MRKFITVLLGTLLMLAGVTSGTAQAKWGPTPSKVRVELKPVPKVKAKPKAIGTPLVHPCDLNKNVRQDGTTETLCMQVWKQTVYETQPTKSSGISESPAGPVVVVELLAFAKGEGYSMSELADAFREERKAYASRLRN